MTLSVRTLHADLPADRLGVTNSHDHLFLATPRLPGEELTSVHGASAVLDAFRGTHGRTIVQWTPRGAQRSLTRLRTLSIGSGVHIVAATGRHRRGVYGPAQAITRAHEQDLAASFVNDVEHRRCGLIKVGVGPHAPDGFERASLRAAARASRATGAPLAVHLEGGTGALATLALLEDHGVHPDRIVLGHLGRSHSERVVRAATSTGAWACLDAFESDILTLARTVPPERLLLGSDTTTATARAAHRTAAAMIAHVRDLGNSLTHRALVENPQSAWALRAREAATPS